MARSGITGRRRSVEAPLATDTPPPERPSTDGGSTEWSAIAERAEEFVGDLAARPDLFLRDARVAYLLIDDARRRACARLFGASGANADLVTLIATVMLVQAAHDRIAKLLKAPGTPGFGDGVLGLAAVREVLHGVAGPSVRDTQPPWTLITVAVLALTARRGVRRSAKRVRSFSQEGAVSFHRRYGYLVDPGHLRAKRAQLRNDR